MKTQLVFLFTFILSATITYAQPPVASPLDLSQQSSSQVSSSNTNSTPALTFKIIDAPNNTFGYDVFVDGRLVIHQTSIPAMPGNEGFKTKEDAANVADW